MKVRTVLQIFALAISCVFTITAFAESSDEGNLLLARDQTRDQIRDRDRLRDQSCLDAIDAARAALDRERIRDAKRDLTKAREDCDRTQDRDRDQDRDRIHQDQ